MNLFAFFNHYSKNGSLGSNHHSLPRVAPGNWLLLLLYHLLPEEKEIRNVQT